MHGIFLLVCLLVVLPRHGCGTNMFTCEEPLVVLNSSRPSALIAGDLNYDLNCHILVRGPAKSVIVFSLSEYSPSPGSGSLACFDGNSTQSKRLTIPTLSEQVVRATDMFMTVSFYATAHAIIKFAGQFFFCMMPTNIVLNSTRPTAILSDMYSSNLDCITTVTAPFNSVVLFSMTSLDIESGYDTVAFYNGPSTSSGFLQSMSGTGLPSNSVVRSTSSTMTIRFKTGSTSIATRSGFSGMVSFQSALCLMPTSITLDSNHPTAVLSDLYSGSTYPNNLDCITTVIAPSGYVVVFNMTRLDTESGYDMVSFYDGPSTSSGFLQSMSGSVLPSNPVVQSSSSTMTVRFKTDAGVVRTGFSGVVSFQLSVCLMPTAITLSSIQPTFVLTDGYPTYLNNMDCITTVTAPSGSIIIFTMASLDTESQYDTVTFYNGGTTSSAAVLQTMSGSVLPSNPVVRSTSSTMTIRFKTDASAVRTGFSGTVSYQSAQTCLMPTTITLSSFQQTYALTDGYVTYLNNMDCTTTVTAPSNSVVVFTINSLDTENQFDTVTFYDGASTSSTVIQILSGSVLPSNPVVRSTSSTMTIRFKTDESTVRTGFSGVVAFQLAVCLMPTAITLSSNQPTAILSDIYSGSTYPNNLDCITTVTAPSGYVVVFNMTTLDTESGYDTVSFYDGPSISSGFLQSMSGSVLPSNPVVRFTSSTMTIRFKTDAGVVRTGFSGVVSFQSSVCLMPTTITLNSIQQTYVLTDGYSTYVNNLDCITTVTAPSGSVVIFTMTSLDTENQFDTVTFYNGGTTSSAAVLQTMSGSVLPSNPVVRSTSSTMTIRFKTDASAVRTGFSGTISFQSAQACLMPTAITLNSFQPTAILSDLYSGSTYPNNLDCTTIVTAPSGYVVVFNMTTLDTESRYDTVTFYDGSSTSSALLQTMSGSVLPSNPVVQSTSSTMTVRFKTDGGVTRTGFSGVVSFQVPQNMCLMPATVILNYYQSTIVLSGTHYTTSYPNNLDCSTIVTAPSGSLVLFVMTMLDTESGYDTITFYDGASTSSSAVLQTMSGTALPSNPVVRSTSSTMTIRFKTDANHAGTGFQGSVSFQSVACLMPATITLSWTQPTANLSDGFATSYLNNLACFTTVTAPLGYVVVFTMTMLDTESGYDTITFYNGASPSSSTLQTMSGTVLPTNPVVQSTSSTMTVLFKTDGGVTRTGFNGVISFKSAACLMPTSITLDSNHPTAVLSDLYSGSTYPNNIDCTTTVTAPSGFVVVFNMTTLDTESGYDMVSFYDGPSISSGFLQSMSGTVLPSNPVVRSTYSSMTVRFRTDGGVVRTGFSGVVSFQPALMCIMPTTITLNSLQPTYVLTDGYATYLNNMDCITTVTAPFGNVVVFTMTSLDTRSFDTVTFYDGASISSGFLQSMSGSVLPSNPVVRSTSSTMTVRFKTTDGGVVRTGFSGTVSFQSAQTCLMPAAITLGSFQPTYALTDGYSTYVNNLDCITTVTAPSGSVVVFTMTNLDTENQFDTVTFYDGASTSSTVLQTMSGSVLPSNPVVRSTSWMMTIRFKTDASAVRTGFSGTVSYQSAQTCLMPTTIALSSFQQTYVLTDGYSTYLNNLDCITIVTAPSGAIIAFTMTSLDTENQFDTVTFYNGGTISSTVIQTMSGSVLPSNPVVRSTSSTMTIRFKTDASTVRTGFSGTVSFQSMACLMPSSITLNSNQPTAVLSDIYYAASYPNNLDCTTVVTAPPGFSIFFTMNTLDTESGYDTVTFYDGASTLSTLLQTMSGSVLPSNPVVQSTSSTMTVRFKTDGGVTRTGFSGVVSFQSTLCVMPTSVTLDSLQPTFVLTDGYATYLNNMDCITTVKVPSGSVVVFTMTDLDTENQFDTITFYDGASTSSGFLQIMSGTVLPSNPVVRSTSSSMTIRFKTDASTVRSGFSGVVSYVTSGKSDRSSSSSSSSPPLIVSIVVPIVVAVIIVLLAAYRKWSRARVPYAEFNQPAGQQPPPPAGNNADMPPPYSFFSPDAAGNAMEMGVMGAGQQNAMEMGVMGAGQHTSAVQNMIYPMQQTGPPPQQMQQAAMMMDFPPQPIQQTVMMVGLPPQQMQPQVAMDSPPQPMQQTVMLMDFPPQPMQPAATDSPSQTSQQTVASSQPLQQLVSQPQLELQSQSQPQS